MAFELGRSIFAHAFGCIRARVVGKNFSPSWRAPDPANPIGRCSTRRTAAPGRGGDDRRPIHLQYHVRPCIILRRRAARRVRRVPDTSTWAWTARTCGEVVALVLPHSRRRSDGGDRRPDQEHRLPLRDPQRHHDRHPRDPGAEGEAGAPSQGRHRRRRARGSVPDGPDHRRRALPGRRSKSGTTTTRRDREGDQGAHARVRLAELHGEFGHEGQHHPDSPDGRHARSHGRPERQGHRAADPAARSAKASPCWSTSSPPTALARVSPTPRSARPTRAT